MAGFSGAVKIGDLNDFIAPSQACVVALNGSKQGAQANQAPAATEQVQAPVACAPLPTQPMRPFLIMRLVCTQAGQVLLQKRPAGSGWKQTYSEQDTGALKVTLNDCLACSGCVTSAETVLLQHQSIDEFTSKLQEAGTVVVVSVSPQSRASLAALHGITPMAVQTRLTSFFKSLGVSVVLDIADAREVALAEAAQEFIDRYQRSKQCSTSAPASAGAAAGPGPLPMLASACPGWVCYAEKTHGDYVLPHISTTKSPQAVMGTLVKQRLAPLQGWPQAAVYHCSVMPCYDKKLEASRDDFLIPGTNIAEVDSCLTTGEVQQMLEQRGVSLAALPPAPLDLLMHAHHHQQQQPPSAAVAPSSLAFADDGSWRGSSGGYMEHVFREAAWRLYGRQLPPGPLPMRTLRNADLRELVLEPDAAAAAGVTGPSSHAAPAAALPPLLRFACAYGFRNIQTLVRSIKRGKCEYDYVEVMACPGGCLNGGGQLAAEAARGNKALAASKASGRTAAQLLDELEELYHKEDSGSADVLGCSSCTCSSSNGAGPDGDDAMDVDGQAVIGAANGTGGGVACCHRRVSPQETAVAIYQQWVGGTPGSDTARALLHTGYHKREKTITTVISDW